MPITPLDHFVADALLWLESSWLMCVAVGCLLALIIMVIAISKVRSRRRDSVPQYRRLSER